MQQGVVAPKSWQDDRWLDIDDSPTFDVDERELAVAIGQVVAEATGVHVPRSLEPRARAAGLTQGGTSCWDC